MTNFLGSSDESEFLSENFGIILSAKQTFLEDFKLISRIFLGI